MSCKIEQDYHWNKLSLGFFFFFSFCSTHFVLIKVFWIWSVAQYCTLLGSSLLALPKKKNEAYGFQRLDFSILLLYLGRFPPHILTCSVVIFSNYKLIFLLALFTFWKWKCSMWLKNVRKWNIWEELYRMQSLWIFIILTKKSQARKQAQDGMCQKFRVSEYL